jgi:hypothetical protein
MLIHGGLVGIVLCFWLAVAMNFWLCIRTHVLFFYAHHPDSYLIWLGFWIVGMSDGSADLQTEFVQYVPAECVLVY